MSHIDAEQLALLALDEPVASDADRQHLADCPACTDELAAMRNAARIARTTVREDPLESPPDRVWARIADELSLSVRTLPPIMPADVAGRTDAGRPTDAAASAPPETRTRRAARRSRRRAGMVWALAAAVVVVAAAAVGVGVVTATSPVRVAEASLVAFPGHPGATGTADVEEGRDGERRLTVTLTDDGDEDGYREVWLIRTDASALVSLGVLDGTSGSFAIPDGMDLAEYALVDISVEPLNGDPAHSGDSIVRGELSFA